MRATAAVVSLSALAATMATPAAAQQAAPAGTPNSTTGDPAAEARTADQAADGRPDDGDSNQIADIVVTAQRREQSLSRIGIPVAAVGGQELQRLGIDDPSDLPRAVPGFQANTAYGGAPVYSLRGVGFNTRNVSATAPIGIYMDEAAVPYPYMSLGLVFDLERVEVLKGPQGTLYGRNTTGGLVDYIAAKPTSSPEGGFAVEVGNYQTINANAYVSGPVADGVRIRLAVNSLNRGEGYQRSVTSGERNGKLYQKAARLTLDLGNDGPFQATLTGNYWKRDGDTIAPQAILYLPTLTASTRPFANPLALASVIPNPTSNSQVDFVSKGRQPQSNIGRLQPGLLTNSEFYSGTAKLGYDLGSTISLASLTSYQHLRQRDVGDAGGVQVETLLQDANSTIKSFSQELRLIGDGERFNWSLGGYFADDDIDVNDFVYNSENSTINRLRAIARSLPQTRYTAAEITNAFGNYRNAAKIDTQVYAAFANAEYKVSDLLKLTAGGRWTRDRNRFAGCTYDVNGTNLPVINLVYPLLTRNPLNLGANQCYTLNATNTGFVPLVEGRQNQSNFAWRGSVDVTPSETTLFYGSISRGYKSGGFPVLAGSSVNQFAPIRQEELTAYEIGTKIGLFDRSVQLNVSGFYYDYKDKQVYGRITDLVFGTLFRIQNIPKSRVYGIDADITWRLTPTLTARASGVYLDTRIGQFSDFTELGVPADITGRPFSYTPKYQGNASLAYDGPITPELRFQAEANVSAQSATQADLAGIPSFRIDDYTLVGGSIGLAGADKEWSVGLYGRNLFNEYYWTGVSNGVETVFRFPGMPREYGLRAAFRF